MKIPTVILALVSTMFVVSGCSCGTASDGDTRVSSCPPEANNAPMPMPVQRPAPEKVMVVRTAPPPLEATACVERVERRDGRDDGPEFCFVTRHPMVRLEHGQEVQELTFVQYVRPGKNGLDYWGPTVPNLRLQEGDVWRRVEIAAHNPAARHDESRAIWIRVWAVERMMAPMDGDRQPQQQPQDRD